MTQLSTPSRSDSFVAYLESALPKDKGLAARLRRADNPSTEHMSWEVLAKFNIDLEKPYMRTPYALVAASMAKGARMKNGRIRLGKAIRFAYKDAEGPKGEPADQAVARLRRVLSCASTEELCRVLRPVLTLIQSRLKDDIDYARLLGQLLKFHFDPERVKAQIAQDFYSYSTSSDGSADEKVEA